MKTITVCCILLAALLIPACSTTPTNLDIVAAATDTPAATGTPLPTATNTARPTWTPRPRPTATSDPCMTWDEVDIQMKGQVVCVRGVITDFQQTRQVGTRYQFSDKKGTFFLYSQYWEIYNAETGKTLGPGTCIEVRGPLDVQSGVPFINIDKLASPKPNSPIEGLRSYGDTARCK